LTFELSACSSLTLQKGLPRPATELSRVSATNRIFSRHSIFTYAIDPDVDDNCDRLADDMAYFQALAKLAQVKGSQRSRLNNLHCRSTPNRPILC